MLTGKTWIDTGYIAAAHVGLRRELKDAWCASTRRPRSPRTLRHPDEDLARGGALVRRSERRAVALLPGPQPVVVRHRRRTRRSINLHLATGQIGRPGAGPFSLTGQPNAMGGREVGGMATLLSAHRDLAQRRAPRAKSPRFGASTTCPRSPARRQSKCSMALAATATSG